MKFISSLGSRVSTAFFLFCVSFYSFADAASKPVAEVAFNKLKQEALLIIGYAWPVLVVVVGASISIKLFKRFVSKAV